MVCPVSRGMATEKEVNMHMLMKDLTIDLGADRPDILAKAFETIAKANINVDGYAEIGGTLHVLTPDAAATRRALEPPGIHVQREKKGGAGQVENGPGVPPS